VLWLNSFSSPEINFQIEKNESSISQNKQRLIFKIYHVTSSLNMVWSTSNNCIKQVSVMSNNTDIVKASCRLALRCQEAEEVGVDVRDGAKPSV
jgi:hypothetical protein